MMARRFSWRGQRVIGLGISYDMLLDALLESGGAVDVDGRYPINEAVKQRLRKLLNARHVQ
jgi:hypothetical protein